MSVGLPEIRGVMNRPPRQTRTLDDPTTRASEFLMTVRAGFVIRDSLRIDLQLFRWCPNLSYGKGKNGSGVA